ncbi:MAG TPA: hypothetical protein VF467_17215 [Afipia sp.]
MINTGIGAMERYAIIKHGRDFIVQSEEQSVLKCTSLRKAARLVADANGLMRAGSRPDVEGNEKPSGVEAQR